jgi:hypothetical protein
MSHETEPLMSLEESPTVPDAPTRRRSSLVRGLLGLRRFVRVIIAAFFALTVALALTLIIDQIYLQYFFSEDTIGAPAAVTMGLSLSMYLLGWWLLVGPGSRSMPDWVFLWYLALGLLSIVLAVVLIGIGIRAASMPIS